MTVDTNSPVLSSPPAIWLLVTPVSHSGSICPHSFFRSFLIKSLTPCLSDAPPTSLVPCFRLRVAVGSLPRQAGSSSSSKKRKEKKKKIEMPCPDNWGCLVPVWLRPIASFTACALIYFMALSDQCGSCEAQWQPVGVARFTQFASLCLNVFLAAMLDSIVPWFLVCVSQTPKLRRLCQRLI